MKHSIDHLPQIKKDELQILISVIRKNCHDVEKIILFGSYARGDYKEAKDLKSDRKSGHVSDYDILVVTAKKETALDTMLWDKISKLCNKGKALMPFRIIRHDIEELNIKLAEGQYFYSDIKKEGILLYDTKKFKLAKKRKLTPKEKQRIAQDYFDSWFTSAVGFYDGYKDAIKRGNSKKSAFELHQAAEASYKTILLVFSNYSPDDHYLSNLGRSAAKKHSGFKNIFLKNTKKQKDRFELLELAYIGARYDPKYQISTEDLVILAKSVKKLLDLTKKICEQKIINLLS
jgi:predicted nucleotidyltransferase/HEPN domain-containing protein